MAIRVLTVEEHATVRAWIGALFGLFRGIELVGEAETGRVALARISKLKPDIVLIDLFMPGRGGLETARAIRKKFPGVKVIVLSLESQAYYVQQALRAGVSGYLLKNLAGELEPAIRAVTAGGTYFSRLILETLAASQPVPTLVRETATPILTPRQQEVLRLIAKGFTTKEIASQLKISVKTAQTHRTELMQRLDIHDVARIVRYAIRNGLVRPD